MVKYCKFTPTCKLRKKQLSMDSLCALLLGAAIYETDTAEAVHAGPAGNKETFQEFTDAGLLLLGCKHSGIQK